METNILARAVGPIPFPTFFTLPELAELLQVDEREVKRMVRNHDLAAIWVGGDYRILTKDLVEWLLIQRQPGGKRDEPRRRRR